LSRARSPRIARLVAGLRHAFDLGSPHGPLTDKDRELLLRLAEKVVVRQMAGPAILFLESLRPLSYIGGQALAFLRPFIEPLFKPADIKRLTHILERRQGLRELVTAIESAAQKKGMDG